MLTKINLASKILMVEGGKKIKIKFLILFHFCEFSEGTGNAPK
jgi:hypothetical protein